MNPSIKLVAAILFVMDKITYQQADALVRSLSGKQVPDKWQDIVTQIKDGLEEEFMDKSAL